MLSTFFKTKPVINESSKEWIFDTFSWCMQQLDAEFFLESSELILPNNAFYPGSSTSIEEMAQTIFANTTKYTGMTKWPLTLVASDRFVQKPMPLLSFGSSLRGKSANISVNESANFSYKVESTEVVPSIDIAFHASQLNQPQDMIAYFVQVQAGILVNQHSALAANTNISSLNSFNLAAPGGKAAFAQTVDLVACFMGFGIVFANTAYQFKGGCGSCNNRNLNRQAALPELETVYALALFCVIKGLEIKQVKKELKSHLYKPFRQAHKEIIVYLQHNTNPKHTMLSENIK
ncbi:hypothetical protein [Colwellia piezophila]|uniref:hypothetical protein n=1 Tax=Colwellia piezophila TaxID=211668 RepID=UPI00037B045B|nr:hypothetical protein [Colwellia piezophila]